MSKIKIKNFGPIKEGYLDDDGFLDIKKVTVFIGNQGSGKSTVAKLISTMMWLEKASNRENIKGLSRTELWEYSEYHGILEYFYLDSEILFQGDKFTINYFGDDKIPNINNLKKSKYITPKIMYVPASRNTLSTISNIKGIPDNLLTFYEELIRANKELKDKTIKLPINDYEYQYDDRSGKSYIVGRNYKIDIKSASSGVQSLAPLFVVTNNLANLVHKPNDELVKNMNADSIVRMKEEITSLELDDSIKEELKNKLRKEIRTKYLSKCFVNIVEEPEQNLYPSSQRHILNSLLEFNNMSKGNKLIMTTHSPYIISYLSLAIQAGYLKEKIKSNDLLKKLETVVPLKSIISANDVAIYQFDEITGTIKKLPTIEGIPSDKNLLNQSLAEGNELFDQLLEIEQEL